MLKETFKRTADKIIQVFCKINNEVNSYDLKNTWVVSGSPRSGTTWLAEVLCADRDNRLLWEPLHRENPELGNMGFSDRPFLEPKQKYGCNIEDFFLKILQGRMLNIHTLYLEQFWRNIKYVYGNGRWIIKFVRGNGVVAYLYEQFGIPKPVVIIRHPCAVVASQRRFGEWSDHPYVDSSLLNRYPSIDEVVRRAKILEEKLAITWACDVLSALTYQDSVQVIFYENVVVYGENELKKMFSVWGLEVPPPCLAKLNEYSSTWQTSSGDLQGYEKLGEWYKFLEPEIIARILNCVQEIGVNIYNENPHHLPSLC